MSDASFELYKKIEVHINNWKSYIVVHTGLPPTSLTTDHKLVYWSNATEGRVYSAVKNTDEVLIGPIFKGVKGVNINGVQQIAALGTHLQPYPGP